MTRSTNRKKQQRVLFFLVLIIGLLLFAGILPFYFNSTLMNKTERRDTMEDLSPIVQTSSRGEYNPSYSRSGKPLNTTIHQSKLEEGSPLYKISNASDPTNNTFSTACPDDTKFNKTDQEIKIDNIYAPNTSITYEDETGTDYDPKPELLDSRYAASFDVGGSGHLENVSVYLSNNGSVSGNLILQVYNSTYDGNVYLPDGLYANLASEVILEVGFQGWYTFSNLSTYLDTSQTEGNTFLIVLKDSVGVTNWHYLHWKDRDPTDGSNDLDCSEEDGDWTIFKRTGSEIDFTLKCDFDIKLKINNKPVSDLGGGKGIWKDKVTFDNLLDAIEFTVTAEWWEDVSCDITQIIMNFTREDLKAATSYNILSSNQTVQWNATLGDFNGFDEEFSTYWMNFTFPNSWENITAYNGSKEISDKNTTIWTQESGFKTFQIYPANNGTNWRISAESNNLLNEILIFLAGNESPIDNVNYSDTIDLNTSFSETISDGEINLDIYSPKEAGNYLNHSNSLNLSSETINREFALGNWTIKNNATDYGIYKVQISWDNGTDAGFIEKNLTINAETELLIESPAEEFTFDSGDNFDIQLRYIDMGQTLNISNANISYSIESRGYRPLDQNVTKLDNDGLYNISIDCKDTDFGDYGSVSIRILATKKYYNNQTTQLNLTITGNTSLEIISPSNGANFDSKQTFNITVEYNDTVRNTGISNATFNLMVDGEDYSHLSDWESSTGIYEIKLNASDDIFYPYGSHLITVNASRTNYYGESKETNVNIIGNTSLTLLNPPNGAYYNSKQTFNITIEYIDTVRDLGIEDANISYILNETIYKVYNYIGEGKYNITIDVNDSDFGDLFGDRTIMINISKPTYQNQQLNYTFCRQLPTNIENLNYQSEISRYSGLNQTITFYFNDTANNEPIEGLSTNNIKVYNYSGSQWSTDDFNWLLVNHGSGSYSLNVSLNGLDTGEYTLIINVSKLPTYEASIVSINFCLKDNYTQINMIKVESPKGNLIQPDNGNYSSYIGSDMYIEFNITNPKFNHEILLDDIPTNYLIKYKNLNNKETGILPHDFDFQLDSSDYGYYYGIISLSKISLTGDYQINIKVMRLNYENSTYSFNLTIQDKLNTKIEVIEKPTEVIPGKSFDLIIKGSFYNGTDWEPMGGGFMIEVIQFEDGVNTKNFTGKTDSMGIAEIQIYTERDTNKVNLTVNFLGSYNYKLDSLSIDDITIRDPKSSNSLLGIKIGDLIPIFIIIGVAAGVGFVSVGIYKGVIVPKKHKRKQALKDIKMVFDDAINMEHLLVIYKESGVSLFSISMGSANIDSDLISGFISAVATFGEQINLHEALSEMKYGDKMVLLSDGDYIRVAIILNKKASKSLREKIKTFVKEFEDLYADVLPKWKSSLTEFKNTRSLVDNIFNTSIILPHITKYKISDIKNMKNNISKTILYEADSLLEEPGRDFFFIGKLLNRVREDTKKDFDEIFMGIRELRENGLLIPIEISQLEGNVSTEENRKVLKTIIERNS